MYITILIAASRRLSSDQEKNKSIEEAYPVEVIQRFSKCNSGKVGDSETCEEHMPASHSVNEYMTESIETEQPKEFTGNQQITKAKSPVDSYSVKPTTMQSDTHNHTNRPVKSQGEEFIYCIQRTEDPSEELDNYLQASVQTDEFCNILKTFAVEPEESTLKAQTVQSEVLHCSVEVLTVPSALDNIPQTSTTKTKHASNTLQFSTDNSDKFCYSLKKNSQTEEHFESLQTANVNSEMLPSFTEKHLDCLQIETIDSMGPCNSLWTGHSEELNRTQTSTVLSEKLGDFLNTTALQSFDLCNTKEAETSQPEHYNIGLSAYARLNDPYHTGQTISNHSEVLYRSSQEETDQTECHRIMETAEDQVHRTVNFGQTSSNYFAESSYIKQPPTVHSEGIYLSRTCDNDWHDRVTANKVAVKGDLNGQHYQTKNGWAQCWHWTK